MDMVMNACCTCLTEHAHTVSRWCPATNLEEVGHDFHGIRINFIMHHRQCIVFAGLAG